MNFTAKFFKEWPTDSGISWWDEGRSHLNRVIVQVNRWQRDMIATEVPHPQRAREVLASIEEGLQTWADQDGGSGWREELDRIKQHVEHVLEQDD